jgi:hypothetical protein
MDSLRGRTKSNGLPKEQYGIVLLDEEMLGDLAVGSAERLQMGHRGINLDSTEENY